MAEERGLELREFDLSKAREKQGLEPMTEGIQKSFLRNILRKNFMNEEQIAKAFYMRYDSNVIENQFIENHYKELYRRYLQLRNNGNYSKDDILQEFKSIVSDKEMEELNNFYMQKKETIIGNEDYYQEDTVEVPETEEKNQTGETELWTNRFKEWNQATDKMPQWIRGKFIKMKSDIVRSIRNLFKEKHNSILQDTQGLDTKERQECILKPEYREAFEEIYEIFSLMPKELLDKIPTKFYEMIKEERDTSYFSNIQEPLEKQKLKNETIIILGLIYRDFLCSPDEKKRLQEKDAKEFQEVEKALEEEIREKYNPNDIFKNRNKTISEETQASEDTRITVVQEEKWYQKLFNLIKNLFDRNK